MLIAQDGSLFVSSYSDGMTLIKLTAAGNLDATFGVNGIVRVGEGEARAVALQPDGKFIIVGDQWNGARYEWKLARIDTQGQLDATFGVNGSCLCNLGSGNDFACGVVIQPNGKLVVSGESNSNNVSSFVLARFNADGTLDEVGEHPYQVPHIILGAYHLWVDSNGALRIKNGAPLGATDGTVVGMQS